MLAQTHFIRLLFHRALLSIFQISHFKCTGLSKKRWPGNESPHTNTHLRESISLTILLLAEN